MHFFHRPAAIFRDVFTCNSCLIISLVVPHFFYYLQLDNDVRSSDSYRSNGKFNVNAIVCPDSDDLNCSLECLFEIKT